MLHTHPLHAADTGPRVAQPLSRLKLPRSHSSRCSLCEQHCTLLLLRRLNHTDSPLPPVPADCARRHQQPPASAAARAFPAASSSGVHMTVHSLARQGLSVTAQLHTASPETPRVLLHACDDAATQLLKTSVQLQECTVLL